MTKSGFVAVVGRPNAGKSTLLNWLVGTRLAMVSHKANATRRRMNIIVMHDEAQIIFVDTPGIHEKERLLNQFMLEEAIKAIGDCDFILFLAPVTDSLEHYEHFLELNPRVPHSILLTKTDTVGNAEVLEKLQAYSHYADRFASILPVSIKKGTDFVDILAECARHLPDSPYLYDPEIMTTDMMRDLYREMIRESVFKNISDEIPYESDVQILRVEELPALEKIYANIIVEKESQKGMVIGKAGATIKRIGKDARLQMEALCEKKVFLKLDVIVKKGWTKDKKHLSQMGYHID